MARGVGVGSVATPDQRGQGRGPRPGSFEELPRAAGRGRRTRTGLRAHRVRRKWPRSARAAHKRQRVGDPLGAHRAGAGRARASQAGSRESEPDPARVRTAAPPRSAPPPVARGGAGAERAGLRRGGAGAGSGRARRGTEAKVRGGIGVAAAADDRSPPTPPRPAAPANPPSPRREARGPEGVSPRARRGCFPPREVGLPALRTRLASSPPTGRPAAAPGTWLRRAAAWRRCACRC